MPCLLANCRVKAFDPSSRAAAGRPEAGDARCLQVIGKAGDEGSLGTDDHQVDALGLAEIENVLMVIEIEVDVVRRGSCVSRSDKQPPIGFTQQGHRDGVLAAARTQQQNVHPSTPSNRCLLVASDS